MIAGIRLRIWIPCGVLLVGILALGVTALMPDPVEIPGPDGRREAAGDEIHRPGEPSRDTRAQAPNLERGQQTPGSGATAWEEPGDDATPRLQADPTARPQTSGGPEGETTPRPQTLRGPERETAPRPQTLQGPPFAAGGQRADGTALDPGEKRVEPDNAPVPEEDAATSSDEVEDNVRDQADETLVEMLVERRLWERPDEDEAAVYELTDEFIAEMSPEERRRLLFGFMNPVGSEHELLSDYLVRPLPSANEGSSE